MGLQVQGVVKQPQNEEGHGTEQDGPELAAEDTIYEERQEKPEKDGSPAQERCWFLVDLVSARVVNQTPAHGEHSAKGSGQGTEAES